MKQINLNTTSRTDVGGNSAKRYRKSGQIPAVIYGESGEKNLLIDEKELAVALKAISRQGRSHRHAVLRRNGISATQCSKMLSATPLRTRLIHVDFVEVVRGKPHARGSPAPLRGRSRRSRRQERKRHCGNPRTRTPRKVPARATCPK